MKIEFYNCPEPAEISSIKLPETPEFVKYRPDFTEIKKVASEYQKYSNVLIIGHGGSITSFYAFYEVLKAEAEKNVYFLNTVDPDYIFELKQKLKKEDTLVISISKSGENITQIEMTMQFLEYNILFITGQGSPLRRIAETLGSKIILHPEIGGRYTGFTEVGLLPAAIAGLDIESLFKGALFFYDKYEKNNLAFQASSILYDLENKGYVDVFMPFYSHSFFALSNIIVQLCHESFGKNGKGQTYFAHEAPESQHHTNQRFFGGKKNICGFFSTVENFTNSLINNFPKAFYEIPVKKHSLVELNGVPLANALEAEWRGTLEDARINSIPLLHLSVEKLTSEKLGELLAFWQLFAVYSSVLRNVNPFDQPQVENSKNISLNKRLSLKDMY